MTIVEALTAIGSAFGAAAAALKGAELAQKRRQPGAPPESARALLSPIETRMARMETQIEANHADIRRLLERQPPPDLSERVERLEDDVRQNATAVAGRHDQILMALGELRGALERIT